MLKLLHGVFYFAKAALYYVHSSVSRANAKAKFWLVGPTRNGGNQLQA